MRTVSETQAERARGSVRDRYSQVAQASSDPALASRAARTIGYQEAQLEAVPEGANLGLGCGNPIAIDSLRAGEVVVDLGCGAGMDVFIAARKVGPTGRVVGVDMTEAMLEKARANAARIGLSQVEFRLGLIEQLPIEDASADAIISNCVVNLSPEKERVFCEAFRVLKPGGRVMISDIVVERPLPPEVMPVIDEYLGCVSSASLRSDYLRIIREAGFSDVRIVSSRSYGTIVSLEDPIVKEALARYNLSPSVARSVLDSITSVSLFARK